MTIRVERADTLSGTAQPPSSKSHTIRALMLATLANGESQIKNALVSEDTTHARAVCEALGATISVSGSTGASGVDLEVHGNGLPLCPRSRELHSGDSGVTTRFVLPMLGLAQSGKPITLDCGAQMRARPITPLVNALNTLGMDIRSHNENGTLPLSCAGNLLGGAATVDGTTSQYISALLMALPCAPKDSEIVVANLNERSYVAMTTHWLDRLGIAYRWQQDGAVDRFFIKGGQRYTPFTATVAGDFSSASALLAAAVLHTGEVALHGLDMNDAQGDKRFVAILQQMGADITVSADAITVHGGSSLHGISVDCNDIPDVLPALAVVATQAEGETELTRVPQARLKETDRIRSMATELSKMGARVSERPDGLVLYRSSLHGAKLHGYHDHRTIMALAVAGLSTDGITTIDTAESVDKTFPGFVAALRQIGAPMTIQTV